MSDLLYYEAEITPGKKYKMGDWQQYAVHNDKEIKGFFGPYRYLSNFYKAEVWYEGILYPSTEAAYQAAKCSIPELRKEFVGMTPAQSKKAWKLIPEEALTLNWDSVKWDVMTAVVFEKFHRHKDLQDQLFMTGDAYLEELNHWNDICWGVSVQRGIGTNWLGKILMKTREFFKPHR